MNTSFQPFLSGTPHQQVQVIVVVPVQNEADGIVKSLEALRDQTDPLGKRIPFNKYEVLVLANNCSDNTEELVRSFHEQHPAFMLHVDSVCLPPHQAHVGTARRLLMDAAANRFNIIGKPEGIIASTDGDSIVDRHWIYQTMEAISHGCDAVGGRIETDCCSKSMDTYAQYDDLYQNLVAKTESRIDVLPHDPWPHHHQFFGASMAVTNAMYKKTGGLPDLPFLEDGAFYNSLFRQDAKIRRSMKVMVKTSDRHEGRVLVGLSEQLKKWATMEKNQTPFLVNCPYTTIRNFENRKQLRNLYSLYSTEPGADLANFQPLAATLKISLTDLKGLMDNCNYFGSLWESVETRLRHSFPKLQIPITEAISILKTYTQTK